MKKVMTLSIEQYALTGLSILLGGLFLAYMYFVSASIVHVVIQKEMKRDFTHLHSEIAQLETTYIAAQHAISADIASLQGFVATTEKVFIDRNPGSLVLRENP